MQHDSRRGASTVRAAAETDTGEEDARAAEERDEEAWSQLRGLVYPGAVYWVLDEHLGIEPPADNPRHKHPVMILGGAPADDMDADLALTADVRVAVGTSWKPQRHGAPPATDEERRILRTHKRRVFQAAGILPGLKRDGCFDLTRPHFVRVGDLDPDDYIGALPPPEVDWILAAHHSDPKPNPYPPTA